MRTLFIIAFCSIFLFSCEKEHGVSGNIKPQITTSVQKLGISGNASNVDVKFDVNIMPNPFIDSTAIYLDLQERGDVLIDVTDKNGAFFPLIDKSLTEGKYRIGLQFHGFEEGILLSEIKVSGTVKRYRLIKTTP